MHRKGQSTHKEKVVGIRHRLVDISFDFPRQAQAGEEGAEAMKKSSSYASANETFGKGKVDWLHGLSKIDSPLITTRAFLICDRDEAALEWNANDGVQVNGRIYNDLLNVIKWPRGTKVSPYLLAWKRREIKNYLLSHTALSNNNALNHVANQLYLYQKSR